MGKKKTLRRLRKKAVGIGSGNHAQCYQHPTKEDKVILVTNCPIRASLARGEFAPSRYFPKNVRKLGHFNGVPAYQMDKYTPVDFSRMSSKDIHVYKEIRHLCTLENSSLPKPLVHALDTTFNMLRDANGYISWDVCEHNMMLDKHNKLILNDILWTEGYEGCDANNLSSSRSLISISL